jgi:hypothetical protein
MRIADLIPGGQEETGSDDPAFFGYGAPRVNPWSHFHTRLRLWLRRVIVVLFSRKIRGRCTSFTEF